MSDLLDNPSRFLFFTGKGGVGKTSLACAVSVALADKGKRVLLISTDPASNLDEVLATALASEPRPVNGVPGLEAMNIDPEAAAREYRERIVGPYRGMLPDAAVANIEEQLSGACTVEIASFNEFSRFVGTPEAAAGFDHVVLDTAPTGHTLRLLSLPAAWNDFIAENKTGSSCLGPLAGLGEQKKIYEKVVAALTDPDQTQLVLVARGESAALKEAARASGELAGLGMTSQRLILNGVFHASGADDVIALAFERRTTSALAALPDALAALPTTTIPFRPSGLIGLDALRSVFGDKTPLDDSEVDVVAVSSDANGPSLGELVDTLAERGSGVVLTMGKGGVGKTTLAAAIAHELAACGHSVHLSTTDPAAHIADAAGDVAGQLSVSRIDPVEETRSYVENVMATAGADLDAEARELLDEELRSPCTEEIAVFHAFARVVGEGGDRFVILDTAPTGHTLLLLDATQAYQREVAKATSELPPEVVGLLSNLRDPDYTRVIIAALPEATPVHEAESLQEDLRRAGIEPFAWVVNQCFSATATTDPLLLAKAAHETRYLTYVREHLATRMAVVSWVPEPPVGRDGLQQLFLNSQTPTLKF